MKPSRELYLSFFSCSFRSAQSSVVSMALVYSRNTHSFSPLSKARPSGLRAIKVSTRNRWRRRCGILRCLSGVWPYSFPTLLGESRVNPCVPGSYTSPILQRAPHLLCWGVCLCLLCRVSEGVMVSSVGPLAPVKVSRLMPCLSSGGGPVSTELDGMAVIGIMIAAGCCLVSRVSDFQLGRFWRRCCGTRELWINVGASPSVCTSRRALY